MVPARNTALAACLIAGLFAVTLAAAGCTRKKIVEYTPAPVSIADPVFLDYCLTATGPEGDLRIDLDGDGILTREETAQVEEIYLDNEGGSEEDDDTPRGVRSLAGIEFFTNLRRLSFGTNDVEAVDLSRNTRLTYLDCSDNELGTLDLSANTLLETVNCSQNSLGALDISRLPLLKYLYCAGNDIAKLDIAASPHLLELACDGNRLETLDAGACPELTGLSCSGNSLTKLTLPQTDAPALVRLDCSLNELTGLDPAGFGDLYLLRCSSNPLTTLDIAGCTSLGALECADCRLTALDITGSPTLRSLSCVDNPDGMKIYVRDSFDPGRFIFWNIGTATVEVK